MRGVVFELVGRAALRLSVVVMLGSMLVLSLAWWWPAQRELDTATYRYAAWDVVTDLAARPGDVPKVVHDFGEGRVALGSKWSGAPLSAASGASADVSAIVVFPADAQFTLFPKAELVAYAPVAGNNWIDIDALTATRLGLRPGDAVFFGGPPVQAAQEYRVRGVYAVAPLEDTPLPSVVVSGAPIVSLFTSRAPGDGESPSLDVAWVSGKSKAQVAEMMKGSFYRSRLNAEGYDNRVTQDSRGELLAHIENSSSAGVSLILGVSVLSAVALLTLILREIVVFSARAGERARLLRLLGAGRRPLATSIALIGGVAVSLGVAAGSFFAYLVLNSGGLTVAFPPTLMPLFISVSAGVCLLAAGAAVVMAWRGTAFRGASR